MGTKTKPIVLREDEAVYTCHDLRRVIIEETDRRIFEIERECSAINIHPATWEQLEMDTEGDLYGITWNHFQGILVVRDGRLKRGEVVLAWKKPA